MRKTLRCLALLAALALPMQSNAAEAPAVNPAGNPVDQFTGVYWVKSTPDNQKAYLFGIDSAVAVEKFIQNQQAANRAKSGKKPLYTLSPFEKGWMEAFKNVSRDQIAQEVTKWYDEHPDSLDRPVLGVIWYELIAPRLKKGK